MNKKKQKNFINLGPGTFSGLAKRTKSFLVLFFKKELLVFVDFLSLMDGLGVTFLFTKKKTLPYSLKTPHLRSMNYSRLGFLLCCFLLPCLVGVFATFSIPAPVVDEMHQRAALQAVLTAPDPKAALANLQGYVDDDTAAIASTGPAPLQARIEAAIANMQTEEIEEARAAAYRLRILLITMTILSAGFGAALLGPGQKHDN